MIVYEGCKHIKVYNSWPLNAYKVEGLKAIHKLWIVWKSDHVQIRSILKYKDKQYLLTKTLTK